MQVGGAGLAVMDKAETGPQFGAEGLIIPLQPGQERLAKSRLGTYCAHQNESTALDPSRHDRAWLTYEAGGCLAQVGGAGLAVIDKAEAGSWFGAEDLIIPGKSA